MMISNIFLVMENELKVKVLDALGKSEPTCFTKENVYKCSNDGQVCFNGMIAELVNGCKYEYENFQERAWEIVQEAEEEALLDEVRSELRSKDLWDDLSEEEQIRLEDKYFEQALENYDGSYSDNVPEEVSSLVAEEISNDLDVVYQNDRTQEFINQCHYDWIYDRIDFDLAMAEVERFIVENE